MENIPQNHDFRIFFQGARLFGRYKRGSQREVRALQLPTQWHGLSNLTVASDLAKIPTPEEPPTGGDAPYFIAVVGKSRVRRLHRQGGCGASTLGVQEMLPVFDISAAVYVILHVGIVGKSDDMLGLLDAQTIRLPAAAILQKVRPAAALMQM